MVAAPRDHTSYEQRKRTIVLERPPSGFASGQYIRRRIYILPSTAGSCFAVFLLVMLLGAINYNSNLGFTLVFLLTGMGLQTTLQTWRNLRGLVLHAHTPKPVFAGQRLHFPVHLYNPSKEARAALFFSLADTSIPHSELCLKALAAGEHHTLSLPAQIARRGLCPLETLRVDTLFPLGLLRAWSTLQFNITGLAYPKPEGDTTLPLHATSLGINSEGQHAGTDDFAGLRRYRPGDRSGTIAWKTLAQGRELMVKQFTGQASRTLLLEWHHVRHFADTERRLSQLCLWILGAQQAGMEYGLRIPGVNIAIGYGERHQGHCLSALALFDHDSATPE